MEKIEIKAEDGEIISLFVIEQMNFLPWFREDFVYLTEKKLPDSINSHTRKGKIKCLQMRIVSA